MRAPLTLLTITLLAATLATAGATPANPAPQLWLNRSAVAGAVVGAGVQSGAHPGQHQYSGSFAGVAPEAGLVIQAFEVDSGGAIIGLNPDYYKLFDQAYSNPMRVVHMECASHACASMACALPMYKQFSLLYADGARLHTDSWGDTTGRGREPDECAVRRERRHRPAHGWPTGERGAKERGVIRRAQAVSGAGDAVIGGTAETLRA